MRPNISRGIIETGIRDETFHKISKITEGPLVELKNIVSTKIDRIQPQHRKFQHQKLRVDWFLFRFFFFLRYDEVSFPVHESLSQMGAVEGIQPILAAKTIVLSKVLVAFINCLSLNVELYVVL